mgnify:CR=1 FL=1
MMKNFILTLLLCIGFIFGSDYEQEEIKTATVKMQTLVGETAINNVLMSYFAGKHEIPIKDLGNITLIVNDIGIDIQKKNEMVFGFDMVLTSDFQSEISNITNGLIKGHINIDGAISIQELKNAYIFLLDLNEAIETILFKYGISDAEIVLAIKKFFSNVDNKIELWKQEYSTLLNTYANKGAELLDITIVDTPKLILSVGEISDNISVDLELKIQSEKQYFKLDGWINDPDKLYIKSNKEFQLLEIKYIIMPDYSLLVLEESCANIPLFFLKNVNVYEICSVEAWKIKNSIRSRNFIIKIKLRTLHGGIILLKKELR